MLEAVELPAGVANLAAGLANVDGDALTLEQKLCYSTVLEYNNNNNNKNHNTYFSIQNWARDITAATT